MTTLPVIWHGNDQEKFELLTALTHNCACMTNPAGIFTQCEAHRALVEEQRFVDGLLFMRRMTAQLLKEEMNL